ncbi:ORF6N domain-containing protein [Mucilaginibacter pineti]|uniref:ORF6N domain-containing protein n=1 Tax=Mucilaginibacter pineti TaxID=1391627 RepID=A0A1G6ZGQ5_9SPHI|nr:ORF6N domain-containing protein [Mucilaginibacter pineti]SDE01427.1 ORF6N domain-containing protein [Mucilaginibacter pineti]
MPSPQTLINLLTGKVFKIRGQVVVFDFDAAALYEVNIAVLHKAVTKHSQRFPNDFMFWLTPEEWQEIAEQISPGLSKTKLLPPLAFTNGGLFMLSSVLKGPRAAQVSVLIIESLFSYKKIIDTNR